MPANSAVSDRLDPLFDDPRQTDDGSSASNEPDDTAFRTAPEGTLVGAPITIGTRHRSQFLTPPSPSFMSVTLRVRLVGSMAAADTGIFHLAL